MVATTSPSDARATTVVRFDRAERVLHWVNATLFGVLMATASILYVGSLSALVGRRELIRTIHVYAGLALPIPILLTLAGRWRRGFVADLRRLNRWTDGDRRWLRSFGRDRFAPIDKFNAGQKLNAAIVGGSIPVMLATGSIMKWFRPFPVDWRTGATFVHDWTAIGLAVLITVHVAKGLSDPAARGGMLTGKVPSDWSPGRK